GGDGRNRSRVLGLDVASARVAIAVVGAGRSAIAGLRVYGGGRAMRVESGFARRGLHHLGEVGVAQRRHGVLAGARAFKDVALGIDPALEIARLAGDADFVFDGVVERFEIVVGEKPVFDRRTLGDRACAIAAHSLRAHLEIPRVKSPTVGVVVNRGAADGVHHGRRGSLAGALIGAGAESGDLIP